MEIHLDSRAEALLERHLRSGRYQSAEQVVVRALEALEDREVQPAEEDRREAVRDMMTFASRHGFTLGSDGTVRDLIEEGRRR
jgi:Arc/MetJ-type ribon-helix-helix transcriptional regulator